MKTLKPPEMLDGTLPALGVFLAGGITNCPDWQKEVTTLVPNDLPFIFCNPRRDAFDVNDPSLADEQIEWEQHWLWHCGVVTFWFCRETVQPITLFELGQQLARHKISFLAPNKLAPAPKLFVGVHPDYPRAMDVRKQLRLSLWDGVMAESLPEHARMITGHLRRNEHRMKAKQQAAADAAQPSQTKGP